MPAESNSFQWKRWLSSGTSKRGEPWHAGVLEGVDGEVLAADQDDLDAEVVPDLVGAGLGQLFLAGGVEPDAGPEVLHLEIEELLAAVAARGQVGGIWESPRGGPFAGEFVADLVLQAFDERFLHGALQRPALAAPVASCDSTRCRPGCRCGKPQARGRDPMIRHIVTITLRDDATTEDIESFFAELGPISRHPKAIEYYCGWNFQDLGDPCDIGISCSFENQADFEEYMASPDHCPAGGSTCDASRTTGA